MLDVPPALSVSSRKGLSHLRQCDPTLAAAIDRIGPYRMQYPAPVFSSLARSIVFQQLNGRAASTIYGRVELACGEAGVSSDSILRLRPAKLRAAGLSQQKTEYIRDLARRTCSGAIDFTALPALADEQVIECLTQVKGIGVWTAQMFLMFSLRRPDILPTADFGIRSAMKKLYALGELPKPQQMESIAHPWKPWRTLACWYLWRSIDGAAA
ncbi:MAG: DNA-3-methyladenine glycosylase 2 family protein [Acidobacteriia bacterium]|nr:DNA-3-methyladenine glycosylase 2 family protein [Terriglobia bacterium]